MGEREREVDSAGDRPRGEDDEGNDEQDKNKILLNLTAWARDGGPETDRGWTRG